MRNLRERLQAVASGRPARVQAQEKPKGRPFFLREHIVPIGELYGIEYADIAEIKAMDPMFSADSWDYRKALFLDTETTGLSGGAGTVAFEIGVGFIDERGLVIRQYVMRDYGEEAAVLTDIAGLLAGFETVVTFNGKSFDLPLLESRMVMNRIRMPLTRMPHLDLLHAARRVYKLRLKRCSLAALEEAVFGLQREDDLPGAQVPQRYFDYIRTGEFALLEDVLRHNLEDVKSLASLTGHLCAVYRNPQMLEYAEDIFGVGKTLMRCGHIQKARSCFKSISGGRMASKACMHLAESYKREKEWKNAVDSCRQMIASGIGGEWPYIELAKYYEHIEHDIPRALRYANGALIHMLNLAPISGGEVYTDPIIRRIERLKHKQIRMKNTGIQEE